MVIISNVKWFLSVVAYSTRIDFLVALNAASKVSRRAGTCAMLFLLDNVCTYFIEAGEKRS